MSRLGVVALGTCLAWSGLALADTVLFQNGDQLTGKVVSVEGGKMVIDTKVAGAVTVDMKDIKTFTTDAPIDLRTAGGERVSAKATATPDQPGQVKIEPSGGAARNVPLADVKSVNFNDAWTGAVIANANFQRGNTYADQAGVAFDATRRSELDRWTFTGGYNFGRQRDPGTGNKSTSTDNWFATGKYDYFFNPKFYAFGSLRYEHDRIAELDYRLTPGVGVGYQWFDDADFSFNTEGGLAYVFEKYSTGDSNDFISLRLAYHLKKRLNSKVALFHNLEYYPSLETLDDYLVVTDAGIRADITAKMFAEYKIEFRYDSSPAAGASRSDLRHLIGLGWKF